MKLLSIKEILCFFVFYIFFFHTSFFLSATESSSQDCVLSIITPHPENTRTEFEAQFIEWHQKKYGRKIFLDWRNVGGASDIIRFIRSEFAAKPDGIGLDIIFGCGIEPYYDLKREGLLAFCDLPDDILKAIPQYCQGIPIWDKDQYWFGCTIASFGILHNLRVIYYNDLPLASQWKELTNPALCDWIGISDPRNSGSMYTMLEAILQFYGWEEGWKILAGIAANTATIGRYATAPPRQTTYGDTASSICIDFYGSTQVTAVGKTNMSFIIPKDFTILSPDGIAMLKGGKNPLEANHFIEFVLGEKGQKLWMFPAGAPGGPTQSTLLRMPVRENIYRDYPEYCPLENSPYITNNSKVQFKFNNFVSSRRRSLVSALIGTQLIDTHQELRKVWKAAIQTSKTKEVLIQIGTPLITEKEMNHLLEKEWQDPLQQNRLKVLWQIKAQERYQTILKQLSR